MSTPIDWFEIRNIQDVDSPALVLYPERLKQNIAIVKSFIDDVSLLRPHIKTHKSAAVTKLLLEAGITKFKCATIAEAEMLAQAKAGDVLLAYQPVGPKAVRLRALVDAYPTTRFSCLVDNLASAKHIASVFEDRPLPLNVYIDLNVGMNRTGIDPVKAVQLFNDCKSLKGITIVGLHAYDGHLRDADLTLRTQRCNDAFASVVQIKEVIAKQFSKDMVIVAGGTPTYPIHAKRGTVECSPGTFIFWDRGYQSILEEQPFLFGALVVTRVISKPDDETICIDLGHKSIAAENALASRVFLLNAKGLEPVGHSEEHMVFKAEKNNTFKVGDVFYGVPYHICPTVALYDEAITVDDNVAGERWPIAARKKKINI